jgi:ubiquinone/menaquinone biosynthesis C-methylase UbiE
MNKRENENPWLSIPASEYEAHMSSQNVLQTQFLNDVLKNVLSAHSPRQIAVIGCSVGNGFEHIDFDHTEKVVAIDINPEYLEILAERHREHMSSIEILYKDVNTCRLAPASLDLIHCALLFEYVNPEITLKTITPWLSLNGILSVVLQVADKTVGKITQTRYKSIKSLDPIMKLIAPSSFNAMAKERDLLLRKEVTIQLQSKKRFYVAQYQKGS